MDDIKYIEASFKLAELLGWKPYVNAAGATEWLHPDTDLPTPPPDWIGDDGAAFRLALDMGLKVDLTDTDERFICYVHTSSARGAPYFTAHYDDHKSKEWSYEDGKALASRYCIALAAIFKLEAALEQKAAPAMDL